MNNCYHGGIHLDGKHPIVAIADGTVIAYRYRKKYIEQENSGKKYRYTNGFVLIRHEYTTPKGQELVFFSLYNHLCPWDEFSEEQKKRLPALFTKPGFKITASGLNVRSSMDSSGDANIIAASKLLEGDKVVASPVDERWAKKDGVDEYFVHKGFAEPFEIAAEPSFDEIVAATIPVKAGAIVGYTGLLEFKDIPEGQTTCHIEVFAGDDAKAFVENLKKDGEKKLTLLQVVAGATLRAREKKYPNPAALVKAKLKANTTVTVIEQDTGSDWIPVREKELTRSVNHDWLDYHDDPAVEGDAHYTPKKEHLADVSTAFDSLELTVLSKFKLVAKQGNNRKLKYAVPEDEAEECWVKKASLGEIRDNAATTSKDIPDCSRQNPDALSFQKESGTTSESLLVKIDGIETARDDEKNLWYHIKAIGVDGWIADNDDNLKKLSAFDWPGFSMQKEEGDTAYDPIIDFNNLSPFFKRIVDVLNTDSDKSAISKDELKKAMKDEKIAFKLSRLVCFHQSEWWVDSEMKHWESVFKKIGSNQTELQKEVFRNICWWDEVSQKCKDFLPTPNVYHWHPVAFVENMREIAAMYNDISLAEKVTFFGYRASDNAGCFRRCKEMLNSAGFQTVSPDDSRAIQMAKYKAGSNSELEIQPNSEEGIEMIHDHFNREIPIIVGVDHSIGNTGNYDNTTDHWVILVGRRSDSCGMYFHFFDPQTSNPIKGKSKDNELKVQNDGALSGNYGNTMYTVTVVRPSIQ